MTSDYNDGMNIHKMRTCSRGQTLVEAVVVVGMVMLLVTGLIAGTTASLKTARTGRSRSMATKLAQDGIEYIRSLRDTSWNTLFAYSGSFCMDSNNVIYSADVNGCDPITTSVDTFTRTVDFNWQDPKMRVTVHVSFLDGADVRTVDLETYFTDWK